MENLEKLTVSAAKMLVEEIIADGGPTCCTRHNARLTEIYDDLASFVEFENACQY